MRDEEDDLDGWETWRQDCAEEEAEAHYGRSKQRVVPGQWQVVSVVEHGEACNGSSCSKGDEGQVAQLAERDKPTDNVAHKGLH